MALACAALAMATAISGTTAMAAGNGGFKTAQPSMLTAIKSGVTVTPLLTVGDVFGDSGFRFEAIPDGISLRNRGKGRVDVYVNHETSKVPFPFNTATPTASNGESDFDNSQVSALILNKNSAGVLDGSFVIPSSGGFQRFCSNYLATGKEGFDRDILFTNEESPDYVFRQEDSWPPPMGDPDEEENGVVLALDVKSRQYHVIYGMGRHNHENNVAIPGFDDLVVLSGDDTFTSGPLTIPPGGPNLETSAASQSQLYSYIASDTDSLLADEGDLWAFVSDDPAFDDYYDFVPGSATSVSGHFIEVPKDIATGKNPDGSEIKRPISAIRCRPRTAAGSGISARPSRPASTAPSGCSSTGASSTTCSTSSASRTSPTTSDPAWATSSTSWTLGGGPRPPWPHSRDLASRRTDACGRWCSTRTTRRSWTH